MTWFLLLTILHIFTINLAAPIEPLKSDVELKHTFDYRNNETIALAVETKHFKEKLNKLDDSTESLTSRNEILNANFQKVPEDFQTDTDTNVDQKIDDEKSQSSDNQKKDISQRIVATLQKLPETSSTGANVLYENTTSLNDDDFQTYSYSTMPPQQVLSASKSKFYQADAEAVHPLENFSTTSSSFFINENPKNNMQQIMSTSPVLDSPVDEKGHMTSEIIEQTTQSFKPDIIPFETSATIVESSSEVLNQKAIVSANKNFPKAIASSTISAVEIGLNPVLQKYGTEDAEFILHSNSDVTDEKQATNEKTTSAYIIESSNVTHIPQKTIEAVVNQVVPIPVDIEKSTEDIHSLTKQFDQTESTNKPETEELSNHYLSSEVDLETVNDVLDKTDQFVEKVLTNTEIHNKMGSKNNNIAANEYNITLASTLGQPLDLHASEFNNMTNNKDKNKPLSHLKDMETNMQDMTFTSTLDILYKNYDNKSTEFATSERCNFSTPSSYENPLKSISETANENSTETSRYEKQSTKSSTNYEDYSTLVSAENFNETTEMFKKNKLNTPESTTILIPPERTQIYDKFLKNKENLVLEGQAIKKIDNNSNKLDEILPISNTELQPELATHFETTEFDESQTTWAEIKSNEYSTAINKKESSGHTMARETSTDINEQSPSTLCEPLEANGYTTPYKTSSIGHPVIEELSSLLASATHMRDMDSLSPQKSRVEPKKTAPAVEETAHYHFEELQNDLKKSNVTNTDMNDMLGETITLSNNFDEETSTTKFEYEITTENSPSENLFPSDLTKTIRNDIKENILTTTETTGLESTLSAEYISETETTLIRIPLRKNTDNGGLLSTAIRTIEEDYTQASATTKQGLLQTVQPEDAMEKSNDSLLQEMVTLIEQSEITTNLHTLKGTDTPSSATTQTQEIIMLTSPMKSNNESTTVAGEENGQTTTNMNHEATTNQMNTKTEDEVISTILLEGDVTTAAPVQLEPRPLILPPPKLEYKQSEDGVEVFYGYSIVKRN